MSELSEKAAAERERITRLAAMLDGEQLFVAVESGADPEQVALSQLNAEIELSRTEVFGDAAIERARVLGILEMDLPDGIYQSLRIQAVLEGWTPGALAVEVARVKRDLGPRADLEALRNGCQAAPYGGDPTASRSVWDGVLRRMGKTGGSR